MPSQAGIFFVRGRGRDANRLSIIFNRRDFQLSECWNRCRVIQLLNKSVGFHKSEAPVQRYSLHRATHDGRAADQLPLECFGDAVWT
jgi:hypothetical protein